MRIKEGGAVSNFKKDDKIRSIEIVAIDDYMFECWINNDCLSYLSINELLELKDEIQEQLRKSIIS